MIEFIAALFNEQQEVDDLIYHVYNWVDRVNLVDDASYDQTVRIVKDTMAAFDPDRKINLRVIAHSGLPEYVKDQALQMCRDGSWVIMLDADERFDAGVLAQIVKWVNSPESAVVDYVYFNQKEIIDGRHVRSFQKAKLFRKEAITFPTENIHADDHFEGEGIFREDWVVFHRKSTSKQVNRGIEYLATYKRLLAEGKIDEGRYKWLVGLHHYVKPR
jgi:glycosyltransferase involved in cell wall biosynthesis